MARLIIAFFILIFPLAAKTHKAAIPHKRAIIHKRPDRLWTLSIIEAKLVAMHFPKDRVHRLLYDERLTKPVKRLHYSPSLSWDELEAKLLSDEWLGKGLALAEDHWGQLEQLEQSSRLPVETLIGVLTIESLQGEFLGDWPAFHVHYKRWKAGTRGADQDLLYMAKYCLEAKVVDCLAVPGSVDGAIGYMQFMPQNLPRFGVDANGDGIVDPFNLEDAAASMARFLCYLKQLPLPCKKYHGTDRTRHALIHYLGTENPYQRIVLRYSQAMLAKEFEPRVGHN